MDDLYRIPAAGRPSSGDLLVATVGSVSSAGVTLVFPGEGAPTQKRYKRVITGQTLNAGDRVLAAKISGSYVVIGKIGYA